MPRENTIHSRNVKAAKEVETLLWRALCDDMEDAKEYIAKDCIMINPFISQDTLSKDGTSVHDALDDLQPFDGYSMGSSEERQIVEVDMMSMSIMYRGTVTSKGGKPVKAAVASTWRQNAGGDWSLCAQLVAPE